MSSDLKLIVPDNALELGLKVDEHLRQIRKEDLSYILPASLIRFNNGDGKALLRETIRDKDAYIITDVNNDSITYPTRRGIHYMGPDEHYLDIIRILSAASGHAKKITLIETMLYQARQDKRSDRESLDCAVSLQSLERSGVGEFITFDAHNPTVYNAIPNTPFENFYATDDLLITLLEQEKIYNDEIVVISPDEGAMNRARVFSDFLGNADIGTFYKRRDYSILVDGHHPIVAHSFLGDEKALKGKTAIIVDDMIDTGGSILDTCKQLKERGVKKVYLLVTFALFTKGPDRFNEAFSKGYFDGVYATNLTYVPVEVLSQPWFNSVDCSKKIAYIINTLNNGESIKSLLSGKEETVRKIKSLRR